MRRFLSARRLSLLLPVIAMGIGARAALFLQVRETRPDQVIQIAPGVYFRHGNLDEHGHCNNGFVIFKDFVLVIDANFPSGAEACLADIRRITDKPVRLVFDTHHHGDHAYGNPVWMKHGAIPVAHEKVVREMARYEPGRWQQSASQREDIKKLGRDTAMPPVITYPDRMVIDDGTQRVEFLHFGTAHTRGDGFAYLPRHRVLFTGDAVVNGPYNYMGDGNTHSWLQVLPRLEELDVDIVAPGHGGVKDGSLIGDQKAFILALHAAVREGIDAGKTVAELRDTVKLPDSVGRYVGQFFRDQITKVYSEMMGLEMPLELEQLGLAAGPSPTRDDPDWAPPRKVLWVGSREWEKSLRVVAPGVKLVNPRGRDELLREVADADAILGTADPEIIATGKKLRWVHSYSAGVNQYVGVGADSMPGIPALVQSNIVLTNGRRCYGPNIADQTFGYILSFSRQLKRSIEGKQNVISGKVSPRAGGESGGRRRGGNFWRAVDPGGDHAEWELRGKTMLIIGVGGIGSQVARRAASFDMQVIGIDPSVKVPPGGVHRLYPPADLLKYLPEADVVVVACPWTRQTHKFFDRYHFRTMKDGSILVNVARGPIVEREALVQALKSGKLVGAAIDVTDPEPLRDDDPLWKIPNLIITPHNAGQADGSGSRRFLLARENLRRFAAGEPLLNVVNKERGY